MKVYVRLIANCREHLPPSMDSNIATVDVPDGSAVEEMLRPFGIPLDDSSVIDSGGVCVFFSVRYVYTKEYMIWPVRLAKLLNLTTGANYGKEEVMQAAERVYNLERMFIFKAGSNVDTLPPRMLNEPLPDGLAKGRVVDLEVMLPEFYTYRGWDEKGWPATENLAELGLN